MNTPITIGSEVTPIGTIIARPQAGDAVRLHEGERYTIRALGDGMAVIYDPELADGPQFICQAADLMPWLS
ncbi:MAG: hypothetical protein V4662_13790 [Verrucomicrobiota bacterium]